MQQFYMVRKDNFIGVIRYINQLLSNLAKKVNIFIILLLIEEDNDR